MLRSETVSIPTNPRTDHHCGYAFVTVSTPLEAERAVTQLNGKIMLYRKVVVRVARQHEPIDAKPAEVGDSKTGVAGAAGHAAIPAAADHSSALTGQSWSAATAIPFDFKLTNSVTHAPTVDAKLGPATRQSAETYRLPFPQPDGLPNKGAAPVAQTYGINFDKSPATSMDVKMNPGRAALIAITNDSNDQKLESVGKAPCLGQKNHRHKQDTAWGEDHTGDYRPASPPQQEIPAYSQQNCWYSERWR